MFFAINRLQNDGDFHFSGILNLDYGKRESDKNECETTESVQTDLDLDSPGFFLEIQEP